MTRKNRRNKAYFLPLLAILFVGAGMATGSFIDRNSKLTFESESSAGTIEARPEIEVNESQCTGNGVDIVFVMDKSGSMGEKLRFEKNAARKLVETLDKQDPQFRASVRLGAVAWAGKWSNVQSLSPTYDYNQVRNFINKISTDKDDTLTCIECAVVKAANLLSDPSRKKFAILVSDGIANRVISSYNCEGSHGFCGNPEPPECTNRFSRTVGLHCPMADEVAITAAENYRSGGISFYVIGYGSKEIPSILESTLEGISGNNYVYAGPETNWEKAFNQIAAKICPEINRPK